MSKIPLSIFLIVLFFVSSTFAYKYDYNPEDESDYDSDEYEDSLEDLKRSPNDGLDNLLDHFKTELRKLVELYEEKKIEVQNPERKKRDFDYKAFWSKLVGKSVEALRKLADKIEEKSGRK